MFKAVIFDLGGTLMSFGDPELTFQELTLIGLKDLYHHLQASGQYDLPTMEAFAQRMDEALEGAWAYSNRTHLSTNLPDTLGKALSPWQRSDGRPDLDQVIDVFHGAQQPYIKLYDDTLATLERFKAAGLKIGLVSNTVWLPRMHDADMARLGMDGFFDHKLYSSAFRYVKPHRAIFEASLEALRVAPAEAVFVGDRIVDDIGGAQSVGIYGVHKDPPERDESHPTIRADATIRTLTELWPIVEG